MSKIRDISRVHNPIQIVTSGANYCPSVFQFNITSSTRVLVESDSRVLVLSLQIVIGNLVRTRSRTRVKLFRIGVLEGVSDVDQELA